jgi:hypothetical protein
MGRIDGVSVANAQGPMQFLPSTWAEAGIGRVIYAIPAMRLRRRPAIWCAAGDSKTSAGPCGVTTTVTTTVAPYSSMRPYCTRIPPPTAASTTGRCI